MKTQERVIRLLYGSPQMQMFGIKIRRKKIAQNLQMAIHNVHEVV
jgi:hypothetical protein